MRTREEIHFEIQRLQGLTPAKGPYTRNVRESISEAIEELKHGVDTTCEEFDNLPDIIKDSVLAARRWKDGSSSDRPSEGYGQLVAKQ